ncbi:MAG: hypothetical protein JXR10_01420 [Cyclobacteriaceae bacterium]
MPDQDKKYRRIGWFTSLTVQLVMLLIFYFLIAWKEPFPPLPTYGIEVSFGSVEQAAASQSNSDTQEELEEPTEPVDEVLEESSEEIDEEVVESPIEPIEPIEEVVEEAPDEPVEVINDEPSPDVVEESSEEAIETSEEIVEEVPEEEPAEEVEEIREEPADEIEEPVEPADEPEDSPAEESNEEEGVNTQGDEVNSEEVSDTKGDTEGEGEVGTVEGTIDDRAIMGEAGNSQGASLQLTGWSWDAPPEPDDQSAEDGEIVFEIEIDSDGYILKVTPKRYTVSPALMLKYKQSVERLTFSQLEGEMAASKSVGTITFLITTK